MAEADCDLVNVHLGGAKEVIGVPRENLDFHYSAYVLSPFYNDERKCLSGEKNRTQKEEHEIAVCAIADRKLRYYETTQHADL